MTARRRRSLLQQRAPRHCRGHRGRRAVCDLPASAPRQSPPVHARATPIACFTFITLGPRDRAGFHAPHVAPFHQRLSVVVGTTMWFWIFYRAYHDGPVVIVRWYPRGRLGRLRWRGDGTRPGEPHLFLRPCSYGMASLSGRVVPGDASCQLVCGHCCTMQALCGALVICQEAVASSAGTGTPNARRLRATHALRRPSPDCVALFVGALRALSVDDTLLTPSHLSHASSQGLRLPWEHGDHGDHHDEGHDDGARVQSPWNTGAGAVAEAEAELH